MLRELTNIYMDDYVEFLHDIRHVYLEEFVFGPSVEHMTFFHSTCAELARRKYTWSLFDLSCLCLSYLVPNLTEVSHESDRVRTTNIDLSGIIEPL